MKEFWEKILFKLGSITVTPAKIAEVLIVVAVTWFLLLFFRKLLRPNNTVVGTTESAKPEIIT